MPSNDCEDEHEIIRLSNEWVAALIGRDTESLARIMARDCTFTYPLEGDGTDQFIADIGSGDLKVEAMVRDNVEVRVFGQTAVLTGVDTTKWFYKGHAIFGYYRAINVYSEREGRWQLVAIQACPISQ